MAQTKTAFYKRYNGVDWDTIYLATSAAQVGESSTRFFIKSSNTVNGKAFAQNGGITLYGSDINWNKQDAASVTIGTVGETSYTITATSKVSEAFAKTFNYLTSLREALEDDDASLADRIKVFEDAWGSGSGSIITTDNMGTKVKIDSDQVSVANTASSYYGATMTDALAKITEDKSALESGIAAKQDKLTITGATGESDADKKKVYSAAKTDALISAAETDLMGAINGKADTYVIEATASVNSSFNVKKTNGVSVLYVPYSESASFTTVDNAVIFMKSLKKGDTILTTTANVSDWFYGGQNGNDGEQYANAYVFYKIEADTPDLASYAKTADVDSKIEALTSDDIDYNGQGYQKDGVSTVGEVLDAIDEKFARKASMAVGADSGHTAAKGFVYEVTQSDGKIARSFSGWAFSVTQLGTIPPTSAAVYKAIGDLGSSVDGKFAALGAAAKKGVIEQFDASTQLQSADLPTMAVVNAVSTKVFYSSAAPSGSELRAGDIWIAI